MADFFIPGELPPESARQRKAKGGKLGPAAAVYIGAIDVAAKTPGRWGMIDRIIKREELADSIVSRLNNGHLYHGPVDGHPVFVHPKSNKRLLGLKHNVNAVKRQDQDGTYRVWIQVLA